jgi:hypothetical protein
VSGGGPFARCRPICLYTLSIGSTTAEGNPPVELRRGMAELRQAESRRDRAAKAPWAAPGPVSLIGGDRAEAEECGDRERVVNRIAGRRWPVTRGWRGRSLLAADRPRHPPQRRPTPPRPQKTRHHPPHLHAPMERTRHPPKQHRPKTKPPLPPPPHPKPCGWLAPAYRPGDAAVDLAGHTTNR